MKRFHVIALLALLLATGCGAARQTSSDAQQDAQLVQQKLDARSFTIDVNYMIPLRGQARSVSSYSISVDGTTLNSHLPYFGEARNVPYGGGNGLSFKDNIDEYSDKGWQKDNRTIVLSVKTEEDTFVFSINVFTNGTATIIVHGRNRDDITYRGNLRLEEE